MCAISPAKGKDGNGGWKLVCYSTLFIPNMSSLIPTPTVSCLWFSVLEGVHIWYDSWNMLVVSLENSNNAPFLCVGALFSRFHITLMSSCPGFTDMGCLALGDNSLGHLPWFAFRPLKNLQIFVPQNRRSSGLLTPSLLTFHYRFIQPACDLRILSEKVRNLSFFTCKLIETHDK